jgi:hypothetical protein
MGGKLRHGFDARRAGGELAERGACPPDADGLRGPADRLLALALRQPVNDQLVAVLKEPKDQLVGQRVGEGAGDPATLVQAVARPDRRVLGAGRFSPGRLALEDGSGDSG